MLTIIKVIITIISAAITAISLAFLSFNIKPDISWSLIALISLLVFIIVVSWQLISKEHLIKELQKKIDEPLLQKAQEKHLEDVKKEIEIFQEHFIEINPSYRSYYRQYPNQDLDMIKSHLGDNDFWNNVNIFKEKSLIVDPILDELYNEVISKAESEIAPKNDDLYSSQLHITRHFIDTVIEQSLYKHKILKYEWLPDRNWQLFNGNAISVGIKSENKHREYINYYSQDRRCIDLTNIFQELRSLRDKITWRIQRCITDSEYIGPNTRCYRCPIIR